jgi:hypothetical protein
VAIWAAHEACTIAGIAGLSWVAPALAALERGEPLPAPFDAPTSAFEQLEREMFGGKGRNVLSLGTIQRMGEPELPPPPSNVSKPHVAVAAVIAAAAADTLRAACDALWAAAYTAGPHGTALLASCRDLM